MVYRQTVPKAPAYLGLSLCINGKRLIKKNNKDKKHDSRITPIPKVLSGVTLKGIDHPVPSEYHGPIITDFLTWLNPYDCAPMNKDGILLGPKDSLTVRQALTAVKSNLSLKSVLKKRKSSALYFRAIKGIRQEKNMEFKRRVVPHSCCHSNDRHVGRQTSRYRMESAKSENPKVDRSVGNKRCYIDPDEWERETASILRSTISVCNKNVNKPDVFIPLGQNQSGIINYSSKPVLEERHFNDLDSLKRISAIGKSICHIRSSNKVVKSDALTHVNVRPMSCSCLNCKHKKA